MSSHSCGQLMIAVVLSCTEDTISAQPSLTLALSIPLLHNVPWALEGEGLVQMSHYD